ncbi:hypothetical protein EEL32_20695 [Brevibacillus laterosporus]|nr:hypothetical protein [Brevibacillus laterosporus]TPG68262.1 hypothetical protein EEL31_06780 [Brevibacillus laterosporus]TPG81315.1 hypothetical protein EEL32_20695 [Brevibacillus laterosporus]
MRKYMLSIVTGVFVFCGGFYFGIPSTVIESHANITKYEHVENLEDEADAIVVVSPEKDFTDEESTITYTDVGRIEDYYTVTDVKVNKVFKGKDIPDSISVIQGAVMVKDDALKYQKDLLTIEGYRVMEKDKNYILFLEAKDNGQYGILGVFQGKVNVDDTDKAERTIMAENDHYQNLKNEILEKYKTEL